MSIISRLEEHSFQKSILGQDNTLVKSVTFGHMKLNHVKNVPQSKKLASHDQLTLFDFTYDGTGPVIYSSEILLTVTSLAMV